MGENEDVSKRSDRLLKNGLLVELFGGRSQEQVVQLLNLLQHLRMRCLVLETLGKGGGLELGDEWIEREVIRVPSDRPSP